jgi:hypothetical protein
MRECFHVVRVPSNARCGIEFKNDIWAFASHPPDASVSSVFDHYESFDSFCF